MGVVRVIVVAAAIGCGGPAEPEPVVLDASFVHQLDHGFACPGTYVATTAAEDVLLRVWLPPNEPAALPVDVAEAAVSVRTGVGLFWDDGTYCDDLVPGGFGPDRQDYVYEGVAGTVELVEHHGLALVRVEGLVFRADDTNAVWPVAEGWEDLPDVIVGDTTLPSLPRDAQRHDL